MGDERIFLKILRASLFIEDLSNEPYFGRIHLAGQNPLSLVTYVNTRALFHSYHIEMLFMKVSIYAVL
jgi:hypothetical protein